MAEAVSFFVIVHASTLEKSSLQFLILTGFGAGGEEEISHSLKAI